MSSNYKLEFTLKQHTPIIHFQSDQSGATLRATELKPKLDKFLLKTLGKGEYQKGIKLAKEHGWLVGKGENPALNYKVHILQKGIKQIFNIAPMYEIEKDGEIKQKLLPFPTFFASIDKEWLQKCETLHRLTAGGFSVRLKAGHSA